LGDFGDYGVAELEYDEDEDEERLEDDDGCVVTRFTVWNYFN
jgi:hypothetical protein